MTIACQELAFAQRTCLRRLARGESAGDLSEALGALYLAQLVDDGPDGPRLTDLGRQYLAALDEPPPTRKTKRPTLESRPLPDGWRRCADGQTIEHVCRLVLSDADDLEDGAYRQARALVAGVEWLRHERAVRAQRETLETSTAEDRP